MIACPKCRAPLDERAKFCGGCGFRLDLPPAAAPQMRGDAAAKTIMVDGPPNFAALKPPVQLPPPVVPAPSAPPLHAASLSATHTAQQTAGGPRDPMIGRVLNGRYRIDAKLGEGGFGAVYRGLQVNMNREVALKVLHSDLQDDANVVARFMREAQATCALRDAHTITTFDFDRTQDGVLFIAMELLRGNSLQVAMQRGPIPWQRVVRILDQMCSSLGEAHERGIVHRDIKPENIYIEQRGHEDFVKVLDFGIAKIVKGEGLEQPGAAQLTAMGQTLGTLEYMSPEQLMGQALDGRSDIYAMGVLAYEMISGRLPFPNATTPAALITAQLRETPPPLSSAAPSGGVPAQLDELIARMIGKKRDERHPNVAALREELQSLIVSTSGLFLMPSGQQAPIPVSALPRPPIAGGHLAAPQLQMGVAPLAPQLQMQAPRASAPGSTRSVIIVIVSVIVVVLAVVAILRFRG